MSGWVDIVEDRLAERDNIEQRLVPIFEQFELAARRAALVDATPDKGMTEQEAPFESTIRDQQTEMISLLKTQVSELQTKLDTTRKQLEKAQERQRNMAEEQYLRTHAVEALHDEILALTLQLNLSEQRLAKFEPLQ